MGLLMRNLSARRHSTILVLRLRGTLHICVSMGASLGAGQGACVS